MIRLFERNETNFKHNNCILKPISCYVIEEANGIFELEIELPKNSTISDGEIIKAPTPRGEQLFRIYRCIKTLRGKKAYARHIFYDLSKNFIINVNLNNASGLTALQHILNNTESPHSFIGTTDITTLYNADYTRINPIQAIIGADNSILNVWGGNLIRDNYNINIKTNSVNRGYEIRMGKNLIGIEDDSDESKLKTRLYPTIDMDGNIITLPEKYVDSPYINNYGEPIIYEEKITLTNEQKELSIDEIYSIMRGHCNELYSKYNIDKPMVNYKVDFVELSKTEQYKHLAILEQLDLYDIVTCKVSHLDINVQAKVIKYKYDCLKERYESIELGSFKTTANYKTDGIVKQISEKFKATESAVDYATNVITGNRGGYLSTRRYPNGKPYELLIMDTEDMNTASNVFRLNNSGLGFSRNGYNGPFNTAMTIDGHIVADYIDTGILTSIIVQSDNYVPNISGTKINLADGTIDSKNFKVDSLGNGTFSGKVTGGSMNINNRFIVDSNGNLTATNAKFSGDITGSTISGSTFTATGSNGTTTISGSAFIIESGDYKTGLGSSGVIANYGSYYAGLTPMTIYTNGSISGGTLDIVGNANVGTLNNSTPITLANKDTTGYTFRPSTHLHNEYASSNHTQSSYTITPVLTASQNISLLGSPNAASTWWCESTFVSISSSDFRLKKNIVSMDDIPDELFMRLKPKQFEFKCDPYNKGINFGLLSQQVESAFIEFGLNPYDYNLIELVKPRNYTDEGLYVSDDVHRINYQNFISWLIKIVQNQNIRITDLESKIIYS